MDCNADDDEGRSVYLMTAHTHTYEMSGAWIEAHHIGRAAHERHQHGCFPGEARGQSMQPPCVCVCGHQVDARGTQGLAGLRSAGRHLHNGLLNDIIWRALHSRPKGTNRPYGLIGRIRLVKGQANFWPKLGPRRSYR